MFSWFWQESFWLPANTTWEDISNGPGKAVVYAEVKDFWVQVPLVAVGLLLKFLIERYVFNPLGQFLQISDSKTKTSSNVELEAEHCKSSCKDATAPTKQLQVSEKRQFKLFRWGSHEPTNLNKFSENLWKGCHYLINVSLGLYVAWGQDWVRDVDKCFDGYPHQGITSEMWWFYMIVSTYYICLMVTHFRDVRRKDFWQMFIHHFVTLVLLFLSWSCQYFRIGCLVQILHETSRIFVEFAKAAKYARLRIVLEVLFAIFVLVWVATRLVLFPVFILPTAYKYHTLAPIESWLVLLLVLMFLMTCYWTWYICMVLRRIVHSGEVLTDDVRRVESERSNATSPSEKKC